MKPAVEALLRHADEKLRVARRFVRSGLVPTSFTTMLTRLFEDRQTGDYDVTVGVSDEEARRDIEDAALIVATLRRHLADAGA